MIVGLTGGIGSGKSTAAREFQKMGITVVDADEVARDVVAPNTPALKSITQKFGDDILINGSLNRKQLRSIVFSDVHAKQWLNELLHPLIRERMLQQLNHSTSVYTLLEAPLLFENKLEEHCHKCIVVDLPEKVQLERACVRDDAEAEQIKNIIASQISRSLRVQKADYILDNSKTLEHLQPQVLRLDQILKLLASTPEFL